MHLNNLIGFENELGTFDKLLKKNKLPHAILLSGKESIGKRLFARELALKIILDKLENSQTFSDPKKIKLIQDQIRLGSYPDLFLISEEEGKSNIAIEQIRSLITSLSLKSYNPFGSVIIIDNAHNMSHAAGNALLKILEEPEQGKYFILLSNQAHIIPETIRSRTQSFTCSQRTNTEIETILKNLSGESTISISPLLLNSLDGSLAAFKLTKEIDHLTLAAMDPAGIQKKINQTLNEISDLTKRIQKLINIDDSLNRKSQLIQFLRSSEKDQDLLKLKIDLLVKNIRYYLTADKPNRNIEYWSELAPEFSQILGEIQIRHLDSEIQLGARF